MPMFREGTKAGKNKIIPCFNPGGVDVKRAARLQAYSVR